MMYVKNVPGWERAVRTLMGAAVVAASIAYFGQAATTGWVVGALGAMAAVSGLLGFCPACAMVGRKLDQ
jgi:hypothetical protein